MEDRIVLSDLRLVGTHGVSDEERARPQEFVVEIECPTDARAASARDDLADTVDYGRLREAAAAVIEGPPRKLVETLAEEIAARALDAARVPWVRVRVTKARPASLGAPASIEVVRRAAAGPIGAPVELHVPDFARAKDFYGRLGFAVEREQPGPDGYLVMRRGRTAIAFWPGTEAAWEHHWFGRFPRETPRGFGVEIVIAVDDVTRLYEEVRDRVDVVAPLVARPWGARDFRVVDPFGYYLRITQELETG